MSKPSIALVRKRHGGYGTWFTSFIALILDGQFQNFKAFVPYQP